MLLSKPANSRASNVRAISTIVLIALAQLGFAASAGAAWQQLGDRQMNAADTTASQPVVRQVGSRILSLGIESLAASSSQLVARELSADGTSWQQVGGKINFADNTSPSSPSLADVGGVAYVAWQEQSPLTGLAQVHVKRLSQSPAPDTWQPVGGALNPDPARAAVQPDVASVGGTAYVALGGATASTRKIFVVKEDASGDAWSAVGVGPSFDSDRDASRPQIFAGADVPTVGWTETLAAESDFRAASFNAADGVWTPLGGALSTPGGDARFASFCVVDGRLLAAMTLDQAGVDKLIVARYDAATTSWQQLGDAVNVTTGSASSPALVGAGINGSKDIWLAHREVVNGSGRIVLSRFDEALARWNALPAIAGPNAARSADATAVAGIPQVVLLEDLATSPAVAWRLLPSVTTLDVRSEASSAEVHIAISDFNLPFAYTAVNRNVSTGAQETIALGGNLRDLDVAFGGLSPLTEYQVRVIGTDGLGRAHELASHDYDTPDPAEPLSAGESEPTVRLIWSRKTRKPPRIRGTASSAGATITKVKVAVGYRRGAGNCSWLLNAKFTSGDCLQNEWTAARGTSKFGLAISAKLKRRMMRGPFEVYAQSFDSQGNFSKVVAYRCGRYVKKSRKSKSISRCVRWA